jgi:hypothetical protein
MFDIRSVDDLNGDGVRDVIAGMGDNVPRVIALSGAGGGGGAASVIWLRDSGSVFSIAQLPDQNGDGVVEIVTGAWDQRVHCYSGRDGATRWDGVLPESAMRVVTLDDVDGDGYPDVAVGSWENAARVLSGADGGLIWRTPVGTLNGGDVWAIDRVGDVTGDGINDVCCGSFDTNVYVMNGVSGEIVWAYLVGNRVFTVRGVPDLSGNGVPDVVAGTQKLSSGGICYAFEGAESSVSVGTPAPVGLVSLSPATPNPFTAGTRWTFRAGEAGEITAHVFDSAGRRIATRRAFADAAGRDQVIDWDGRDVNGRVVPPGVYGLRVAHNGRVAAEAKAVRIR